MTDMTVAKTILQQLGGNRFVAMTGTKNFVGCDDALVMSLPRNKSKANKLRIVLTPMDTYTMEFQKINMKKMTVETVKTVENVYCDLLQDAFMTETGMYTSL